MGDKTRGGQRRGREDVIVVVNQHRKNGIRRVRFGEAGIRRTRNEVKRRKRGGKGEIKHTGNKIQETGRQGRGSRGNVERTTMRKTRNEGRSGEIGR